MGTSGYFSPELTQILRERLDSEQWFGEVLLRNVRAEPPASERTDHAERISRICRVVAECRKCALHRERVRSVCGEGAARATVLFLTGAPGADAGLRGRCLSEAAEGLLDKIIAAMRLNCEQVFITATVRCVPDPFRPALPEEMTACREYLDLLLDIIRPRVICALGAQALSAVCGPTPEISRIHGTWYEYRGIPVVPTFAPDALLRNPQEKKVVWRDMQTIMNYLGV